MDDSLHYQDYYHDSKLGENDTTSDNDMGDIVKLFRDRFLLQFHELSTSLSNNSRTDEKFMNCFYKYVQEELDPDTNKAGCPVKFDGVSCWPKTDPATLRIIPCFKEFFGVLYDDSDNATLYCDANGTWADRASYGLCRQLNATAPVSSTTTINLIFYVGYSISLIAVLFALWIFISFKDLRCLRNTIHTNLLATYLLHDLFWLASASLQSHLAVGVSCCFFVALNYFTLNNFMWMFVEGLYLYILVVKTFSVENIKLRIYVLIGWGVPLPIIITWMVVRLNMRTTPTTGGIPEDTYEGTCSLLQENYLDWMVRIPVLLVLTFNILFLVRIMWVLITKLRSANTVETQRYWKASKALLVLIPLLGLTYMLLIALPQAMEHFRAVLLSTQGFWVALFYCFLNSEVRNSIRHHIERWRTERGIAHNRGASMRQYRDSSPRSRTDRFSRRLFGGKRESLCCSEVTTMTTFATNGYNLQPTSVSPQLLTSSPIGYPAATAAATLQVGGPMPRSSITSSQTIHSIKEDSSPSPGLSASMSLLENEENPKDNLLDHTT